MGLIHILDTEVSNKIAAGEVVERPLSIVKELVENSIDAGANVITVEIKDGGISYIRVTDNGSGMSEEDAKICFLRHATSKIKTGDDLNAIYTLGFRGEALSSIGAVAKVKLYTKKRDMDIGICVSCEGGEILSSVQSGVPDGTVIEVSDLFYNTPARRKFLKKETTEGGYISDILSRYIFAHPEISFKLIRDGKETIFSSGDNNLVNAVYCVYGKDYAKNMLEVDYEYNGIRITGLIGKGTLARANRNYETFLVNKRYIKSGIMMRALEEAYKNQIMISKFPTAILDIEISAENVDINVHPTKLECKFSNEQEIYQAIYHAVKSALYAIPDVPQIEHNTPKSVETAEPVRHEQKSLEDLFREKLRETEMRKQAERENVVIPQVPVKKNEPVTQPSVKDEPVKLHSQIPPKAQMAEEIKPVPEPEKKVRKLDSFAMLDFALEHSQHQQEQMKVKSDSKDGHGFAKPKPEVEDWRSYLKRLEAETEPQKQEKNVFSDGYFRVIGQVFDTYILVEKDENLLLIDQHAAHERLNFEALKEELANTGIMSQMIMEPIEIRLDPAEREVYEENKAQLREFGFEASLSGDNLVLTAIPGDISWSDGETLVLELLTQMADMKNTVISEKKERLLYTISCKASIKANMKISEVEMEKLVGKVFKLENINTCPHGRPIVISMSKKQIEKDFKRIV
ncbi:MAG: DNA mismatch repair endonuclease MutL [Clostridia bacterium]|nr:DNA mismatch repair endonuclease MutL [Clostridia bacterium]